MVSFAIRSVKEVLWTTTAKTAGWNKWK